MNSEILNKTSSLGDKFQVHGISLTCPKCKRELICSKESLLCSQCNSSYPIQDGIPLFSKTLDEFYEGRYTTTHRIYPNIVVKYPILKILWWIFFQINIVYRPMRVFRHILRKPEGVVLDLGCGGGTEWFTVLGHVVGMDVSLQSLKIAGKLYPEVIQGDILTLPFPANSCDYVIASHVIGHIPEKEKGLLLSEIKRILKPGGRMILFAETKADNLFQRLAKRNMELYQKYFILKPGHHGLEYGPVLCSKIESHGFQPILIKKLYGSIWAVEHYIENFSPEYSQQSTGLGIFLTLCKMINRMSILRHTVNCFLGVISPCILFIESPNSIQEWFLCYEKRV